MSAEDRSLWADLLHLNAEVKNVWNFISTPPYVFTA
jgi:hypothetical protein